MRSVLVLLGVAVLLTGCTPSPEQQAAAQAQRDADVWAAMGYEGNPPVHTATAIHNAIYSIGQRSDDILLNGSTDADCEPYLDAFKVLLFADFPDSRQDYIAPLSNALSQVYSGCHDRGTWEGTIDDVAEVSELAHEFSGAS